jgi:Na+/melibiose symporter-like transporter
MAKKLELDNIIKLLLIGLFIVLVTVVYYVYKAGVEGKLSYPLLFLIVMVIILPTVFLIIQLITSIALNIRTKKYNKIIKKDRTRKK